MFDRKIIINVEKKEDLANVQNIVNKQEKKSIWQRICDYFHLTPKIYLDLNNIPDNIIIQIGNKNIIFNDDKKEIPQIQPSSLEMFKQAEKQPTVVQSRQLCMVKDGTLKPIVSIKKFNISDIKI